MNFAHAPAELVTRALGAPMNPNDVRRMLVETGYSDKQIWGYAIGYATADAMRKRLDTVLGLGGWSSTLEVIRSDRRVVGMKCRLDVTIAGMLVHREDVAPLDESADDALKACASNAFKRAAQALCVFAYLRNQERVHIEVVKKGGRPGVHQNEDGTRRDFRWDIPQAAWDDELRIYNKAWHAIEEDLAKLGDHA